MSSIFISTQQQAFVQAPEKPGPSKQELQILHEKRQRLMRSASIERIRQFNTYICSQNYFILPALIAWLKTSQSATQFHIEKCITLLKALFIGSIVYKVFVSQIKACAVFLDSQVHICLRNVCNSDAIPAFEMLTFIVHHSLSSLMERVRRKLFVLGMYATLALIFLQLATCIFFMCNVYLPVGLIFMFVCIYLISHLNVRVLFHYLKKEEDRLLNEQAEKRQKKFILGKKTISNFNLF